MTDTGHLGYLAFLPGGDDGYVGALLVLNEAGVPLEFRATFPVRPTVTQRILFGDALEPHIGIELCGKPLLKASAHRLAVLLVSHALLINVRGAAQCPVLHVLQAGAADAAAPAAPAASAPTGRSHPLESKGGRFPPVVVRAALQFPGDVDAARPVIERFHADNDLLEPFARIVKAVDRLRSEDERFR
jgi:hypothetical protein